MEDQQRTESLKSVMQGIRTNSLRLPEFQRDFVWDIERTYDLFDSIIRDIFIGAVIYGKPSFSMTVREIDYRPRTGKDSRKKLLTSELSQSEIESSAKLDNLRIVLDGQQRITAVYRALYGIDKVYFLAKSDFDIPPKKVNDLEEILEEVSGRENENVLSVNLNFVWGVMNDDFRRENERLKVFQNSEFYRKFLLHKSEDIQKAWEDYFLTIVDKLSDLFKSEKLLTYYLLNTDTVKFALFFERSNSRGVQLSFIDILSAKIYHGFKLRREIEKFEDSHPDIKLDREIIVRVIAYFVSKGFEIGRSYILEELTAKHFKEYWEETTELYVKSIKWLYDNKYIISQNWLPYPTMIMPVMIYLKSLPNKVFSAMGTEQLKLFNFWYWASIFSQRYSQQSGAAMLSDTQILVKIAEDPNYIPPKFFISRLRNTLESHEDLYSISKRANAIYRGIFCLINFEKKGYKDWNNGSNVSFNSEKLEDHHIFPRKYIQTLYSDDSEELKIVDSIVNRTLIPKISNIKLAERDHLNTFRLLK
ncbi:GmrSD restriction endonuclease domain-containing protein [Leptospira kmetyi]|uniref:GmrSD restriction endonuclease domain-containing protein n=1 Tax=Leptospira kmetyi TaxID=408139 RepID=UPI001082CFCD|nr:DUF262 domain-containing protein [Leptospira kmetyi]TGL69742.1 DUF262 domain-containing protein [Leptospira kmetyi]